MAESMTRKKVAKTDCVPSSQTRIELLRSPCVRQIAVASCREIGRQIYGDGEEKSEPARREQVGKTRWTLPSAKHRRHPRRRCRTAFGMLFRSEDNSKPIEWNPISPPDGRPGRRSARGQQRDAVVVKNKTRLRPEEAPDFRQLTPQ